MLDMVDDDHVPLEAAHQRVLEPSRYNLELLTREAAAGDPVCRAYARFLNLGPEYEGVVSADTLDAGFTAPTSSNIRLPISIELGARVTFYLDKLRHNQIEGFELYPAYLRPRVLNSLF